MSSLARRSLRMTAAAAGIAAVGVGIAGPAVAAPLGLVPASDSSGPAAPDATQLLGNGSTTPPSVGSTQLPDLFQFSSPMTGRTIEHTQNDTTAIRTADVPPLPNNMPGLPQLSSVPGADILKPLINTEGTKVRTSGAHAGTVLPTDSTTGQQNNVGNLQQSGPTALVGQLASHASNPTQITHLDFGNPSSS